MSDLGHILVIDDQATNVRLLEVGLRALGYRTDGTTDPEEGLRLAAECVPDLVITDVMMPRLDGYEVTRRLKASERTRLVPVILATALDGTAERIRGLECGADEFLTKPISQLELRLRVRSLVRVGRLRKEVARRRRLSMQVVTPPKPADDVEVPPAVLLVEDDEALVTQCRLSFRHIGIETIPARSLQEARAALAVSEPSVILVDLMLPDGDGTELLAQLRADERFRLTPILMLTARSDLETKLGALECGADEFLVKPVNHRELQTRVQQAVRWARAAQEQQARLQDALDRSVTDAGTGLHNRRFLFDDLSSRLGEQQAGSSGFALLLCDLDHFKGINDSLGHLAGDRLLREFAWLLRGSLRLYDLAARYGGGEFVAVLPSADAEVAARIAERIRADVESRDFGLGDGRAVTLSIGVTVSRAGDTQPEDVLQRADVAVYAAKEGGRNCVRVRTS